MFVETAANGPFTVAQFKRRFETAEEMFKRTARLHKDGTKVSSTLTITFLLSFGDLENSTFYISFKLANN